MVVSNVVFNKTQLVYISSDDGGKQNNALTLVKENKFSRKIIQFSEKIYKQIGPIFFGLKLTWPKLFQTERTRATCVSSEFLRACSL